MRFYFLSEESILYDDVSVALCREKENGKKICLLTVIDPQADQSMRLIAWQWPPRFLSPRGDCEWGATIEMFQFSFMGRLEITVES